MKYIYEEVKRDENTDAVIKRTDENGVEVWIPIDESNADYQAYLNPVEHLTEKVADETETK